MLDISSPPIKGSVSVMFAISLSTKNIVFERDMREFPPWISFGNEQSKL